MLQRLECLPCFLLRAELHKAKAPMVLAIGLFRQFDLFESTIRLEHFTNFLWRALKCQIFDNKLLANLLVIVGICLLRSSLLKHLSFLASLLLLCNSLGR